MKTKNIIFYICSFLIIFLVFYIYCIKTFNKKIELVQDRNKLLNDIIKFERQNRELTELSKINFLISDDLNILLKILEKNKIYIRINKNTCIDCYSPILQHITENFKTSNYTIITNNRNAGFTNDLKTNGFNILNTDIQFDSLDSINVPYFILRTEQNLILNFFDKNNPDITIEMLNKINDKVYETNLN